MNLIILVCLCVLGVIVAVVVPVFLIQKGFDFAVGCLGNVFVIIIAGVLLVVYSVVAEVDICQVWLIGEPICSIVGNF